MSQTLEFIMGRAGTGKTAELDSRIAALAGSPGAGIFVIVPEQATFETESRLSRALGGGIFGITVTSWKGLARRVLDGMGVRRAFLSDEGRIMLIRRAIGVVAKDLGVFARSAERRGFPVECDNMTAKFKRCGMCAADVMSAAESLGRGDPLGDKLADFALIFAELERRCEERYMDSEDMLRELAARMGDSPLKGAHVFIDGGDTVHEYVYPIFSALLDHAAGVTVTLTLDPDSRGGVFSEEEAVYDRLRRIAEEKGIGYRRTALRKRMRGGKPAIVFLENELFEDRPRRFPAEAEGLSIYTAPDRTDEVAEAAERIRAAALSGVRYRDMAVIAGDLGGYAPLIRRIFPKYGIPFFTDAKRGLLTHPVSTLLLAALRTIERGFDSASLIEALKTGYFDLTPDETEELENCLLKAGITGNRLLEPFTEEYSELEDARLRAVTPILKLREALADRACSSRAAAVCAFMEELGISEKQRELCARLRGEGRLREESENAQVVNTILEVLDQLYVIMGDEKIGLTRFIAVLREGMEAYGIGMIPSTLDQVLVGSPERTRTREVSLLIVLGMNDGLFPKPRKDEGAIGDRDLERLKAHGYELWKSSKGLAAGDMLNIYRSLTKACGEIVFSYPVSIAGAGSMDPAAAPCRLLTKLRSIFPMIPEIDGVLASPPRSSEQLAFLSLGRSYRRMMDTGIRDAEAAELTAWFNRSPEYRGELGKLKSACMGEDELAPLGEELAGRLYGRSLYGSASRLESFNGCPFRHFMQYGMGAKERERREEKNTELGLFYHEALESYVRYVMEKGLDWTAIDDAKTFEILAEILPGIMYRRGGHLIFDTARQRARLWNVVETVRYTCCAVTRQIARGRFRPEGCEVSFGRAESVFPPLRIQAGGAEFYISGIIDRIDSAGDMNRIIDYKSGGKEFDFAALRAGLQLQLPLYAAAANSAETVGMYYMPITDVKPKDDGEGDIKKELTEELLRDFRLSGITLRDPEVIEATEEFEGASSVVGIRYNKDGEPVGSGLVSEEELKNAVEYAERKAARTLEGILEGDIAISPAELVRGRKRVCRYCPYIDICKFDPDLKKAGVRRIYPMSADAFFGRDG